LLQFLATKSNVASTLLLVWTGLNVVIVYVLVAQTNPGFAGSNSEWGASLWSQAYSLEILKCRIRKLSNDVKIIHYKNLFEHKLKKYLR